MNCDDISRILDDSDVDRLGAAERTEVHSHLEACADCARDWEVHERLRAVAAPRMPDGLRERCRAIVSSRTAAPVSRRAGGRPLVVGGLLLAGVAAAAAVVGFVGDGDSTSMPVEAHVAERPDRVPSMGASREPTDRERSEAAATRPELAVSGDGPGAVGASLEPAGERSTATGYTVAVAPPPQDGTEPVARTVTAAVHAALLDALRAVPNLVVVELDRDAAAGQMANVTATFEAVAPADGPRNVAIRAEAIRVAAGGQTIAAAGPATRVYADVVDVAPSDRPRTFNFVLDRAVSIDVAGVAVGAPGIVGLGTDSPYDYRLDFMSLGALDDPAGQRRPWSLMLRGTSRSGQMFSMGSVVEGTEPVDPIAVAAELVDGLRRRLFPPDAALLGELRARVLDSALAGSERLEALRDLRMIERRGGLAGANDAIVAAVIEIASAATGELRAEIWRLVRGMNDARLVQPLVDSLLYDQNPAVRLEATRALADFAGDPVARAALEYAGRADASPALRMHARWAMLDDAGRRDYVVATLLDGSLPDTERLAPLVSMGTTGPLEGIERIDLGSLIDADAAAALSSLLARSDNPETKIMLATRLAGVGGRDITEIFLRMLAAADESDRFAATLSLSARLGEPGVRAALEAASADDPSDRVRAAAANALEVEHVVPTKVVAQ